MINSQKTKIIQRVAGDVIAPFLYDYVSWIFERSAKRGISRIYFFSRDGLILYEIAKLINAIADNKYDLRYLLVSRKSLFSAAIHNLRDNEFKWIVSDSLGLSFAQIIEALPISKETARYIIHSAGHRSNLIITSFASLLSILQDKELEQILLQAFAEYRDVARAYFLQQGLYELEHISIVDIGWHGRLQHSLAKILHSGASSPAPYLNGLYLGLHTKDYIEEKSGIAECYLDEDGCASMRLSINAAVIELFTSANHGSVQNYALNSNGDAKAVCAKYTDVWGVQIQLVAILQAIDTLIRNDRPPDESNNRERRSRSFTKLLRFTSCPSFNEAEVYGSFPHAADHFHGQLGELAPAPPLTRLITTLLGLGELKTHWPQGSLRRFYFLGYLLCLAYNIRNKHRVFLCSL